MGHIAIENSIQNRELSLSSLLVITVFLTFFRYQYLGTKLKAQNSNLTEQEFKQANTATAILNEWDILSNRKDYFTAIKKSNWIWEGIKVTAILKNGKLYVNSMVTPSVRAHPFTFGHNRKNKVKLLEEYKSVLEGNDVLENANIELEKRENDFWKESEWTLANTLKRIVGYLFSIIFIMIAVLAIVEANFQLLFFGVFLLIVSGTYIVYDIKVILEKRKKQGHNNKHIS
ncbi:hypothetical protein [Putridiphycobacter roseus]|nr:hypothetical protein [Putridiphycobacter roseus]